MDPKNPRQLPDFLRNTLRGSAAMGAGLWATVEPRLRQWGAQTKSTLRQQFDGGYERESAERSVVAPAITFDDVTAGFGGEPALCGISGTFYSGSMSAVVGPNGAGKSTLLRLAAGLLRPAAGTVRPDPVDSRAIVFLPQRAEVETSFPITALDFVALGAWRSYGALATPNGDTTERARQALAEVGLADAATRLIGELSIGNLQRLLFARLLLLDARCVLLDEPFAAIDEATADDLLAVLRRWHDEGRTIVAVLHDLDQARAAFPDCVVLARRIIGWGPTGSVLTDQAMRDARTAMRGN